MRWIRTYALALIGALMVATAACDMLTPQEETAILEEVDLQEQEGGLSPAVADAIREAVAADNEGVDWQQVLLGILGLGGAYLGIQLRGITGGSNAALLREILAAAKRRKTAEDVTLAAKPSILDSNAGTPGP